MADTFRTVCLAETASTNSYTKEYIAAHNEENAVLILAKCQSAGRGRQGKSFFSPDGGLYMSLLLPGSFVLPAEGLSLTAAAAVAICEVLQSFDIKAEIKWVNDIYWQGKKLCGILCESVCDLAQRPRYIIGIGLNLRTPAQGFPEEIAAKATALDMDISAKALAEMIAEKLLKIIFLGLQQPVLYEKYKTHSLVLGKRIVYIENGIEQSAQVLDIRSDGALEIITEKGREILDSGEISILL